MPGNLINVINMLILQETKCFPCDVRKEWRWINY